MSETLRTTTVATAQERKQRAWPRIRAPMVVAAARLRARPGRTLLVVTGVSLATAMLVTVFGVSLIARDRSVQGAIGSLPTEERSFRVDLVGLAVQQPYTRVDHAARAALAPISTAEPRRVTFFRDFWLDREFVRLAGIDSLGAHVTLLSGRLPSRCTPRACEVLQLGRSGRRLLHEGDITLVRVGVAELRDPAAFGLAFQDLSQYRAQQSLVRSTVLLAPSASSFERLPAFQLLFRVHSWVLPIDPESVHTWQLDDILNRESNAQNRLRSDDPAFTLTGPDQALLDARRTGEVSGNRMVLIGGAASTLLLGFALVAAFGLRRSLASERYRLLQRGATRPQVWLALVTELGTITFVGWLLGIVIALLAVAVLAGASGLPAVATLRHALTGSRALLAILLGWAIATATVVGGATISVEEAKRRRRVGLLDMAALGAAATVVIGITRGAMTTDAVASGGNVTLLLILPALVGFAGGVAAWRLLPPSIIIAERLSRRSPVSMRLALLALARASARPAVAAAFLVVSIGLALFAASYSATLGRGATDESAFTVPLDVTLSQGVRSGLPFDIAPLERYRRLGAGVRAYPVLRRAADVADVGTSVQSINVLGVPPGALKQLHWRNDFASSTKTKIVSLLDHDGSASLAGPVLPPSARQFRLPARLRGTALRVDLLLQDERQRLRHVPMGRATPGSSLLSARVPRGSHGSSLKVVGIALSLPRSEELWLFHLAHEGRVVAARAGSLFLQPLSVTDAGGHARTLTDWSGWLVRGANAKTHNGRRLRVDYSFQQVETLLLRPHESTDGRPLRVLVSPSVATAAGPSGLLTLDFGGSSLPARIIGVARRFPTLPADEGFAVADQSRLATALDADVPGTAEPGELWLSVPKSSEREVNTALDQRRFSSLDRLSRRSLLREREHDPLSRAIVYILGSCSLLALTLATLGVWITLVSETRDETGQYFDLEAQGVGPETLRRHLRYRALLLLGYGISGGVLLGFILSRLVVSVVHISVTTESPQPPLVWDAGWPEVGVGLAALALATALVTETTVRHAFRGDRPARGWFDIE